MPGKIPNKFLKTNSDFWDFSVIFWGFLVKFVGFLGDLFSISW